MKIEITFTTKNHKTNAPFKVQVVDIKNLKQALRDIRTSRGETLQIRRV